MSRRLPPLNALRAFEAAARRLSFAEAAEELAVTPPAISHQIRQLEDWLEQPLFRRLTRKVVLTDEARAALPLLSDGFDRLAEAVARLRQVEDTGTLTVSVAPSFASRWLVPRVERFQAANPGIDLRISANIATVDFRADDVDVAVRFGRGGYAGLRVDKLMSEAIAPLCSPRLLAGEHPLRSPDDLKFHTLLHDDTVVTGTPMPDWRLWLRINGYGHVDASRGPRFSYADHALQAAADGHGVLLGRLALARSDIAAGRLVRPFGGEIPTEFGYYLVRPDNGPDRPKVAAFRDWMLAEVSAAEADGNSPAMPAA